MIIETLDEKETYELGRTLGSRAVQGSIYCLNGDLGTGKTVFAKGFAKGLGIEEEIASPTFTIVCEYHDGRLPLYHFDVYRLGDGAQMDELGYEEYFFGDGVCLVEWGSFIRDLLPEDTVCITIEKCAAKGFDYRKITIDKEGLLL